jgi:hypothetical protein
MMMMMRRMTLAPAVLACAAVASAMHTHDTPADAKHPQDAHGKTAVPATQRSDAAAFERLKSLVGDWTAKTEHGEHTGDAAVNYRLTAGGSVLMETLFAGTPNEMVTMYYLDGGKLVLTHYCMLHNQPHMTLEAASTADVLRFTCDASSGGDNLESEHAMHMHRGVLTFVDAGHIQTAWTMWVDGKADHEAHFDLRRVKP